MGKEEVWLQPMDGSEFEKLCQRILEKLGYGIVEDIQYVRDEGRDLIVRDSQGRTKAVVECKHHPEGTIGRPVIQKLHSAAITSHAEKGILITTGKYSKEALSHAKTLSPPIELIDLNLLTDMADRAGIRLLKNGAHLSIMVFGMSTFGQVKIKALKELSSRFTSSPASIGSLFEIVPRQLQLEPLYLIKYSIAQDFSTSVGLIHSIRVTDGRMVLTADTGTRVNQSIVSFISQSPLMDIDSLPPAPCPVKRKPFALDVTGLKQAAVKNIINNHTTWVSYVGRNNRKYTQQCCPGERSVFIHDIRHAYLPAWAAHGQVLAKNYSLGILENPSTVRIVDTDIFRCDTCGKDIEKVCLVCNSCGAVTHCPTFFTKHGFKCHRCKKTICRSCAYWIRRFFFFKEIICEACADSLLTMKKKPKRKLLVSRAGLLR